MFFGILCGASVYKCSECSAKPTKTTKLEKQQRNVIRKAAKVSLLYFLLLFFVSAVDVFEIILYVA